MYICVCINYEYTYTTLHISYKFKPIDITCIICTVEAVAILHKLYIYTVTFLLFSNLQVTAAEVAHIYHTVKHGLSYNSAECAMKLTLGTLNDSSIAKKMSCGRTKAEAIVTDVLSPKAIEEVVKKLKSGGNPLPFSLHTDASNKGNRKMFPLAVQFFTPEDGVVNKVIDFFENPDESAQGILEKIQSSLENLGLSLDHVSAFSADNANVNYGSHNSVFTKLREPTVRSFVATAIHILSITQ